MAASVTGATVTSVTSLYKDLYPRPGTRIKQWVIDDRAVDAWERETCPQFPVDAHDGGDGITCPSCGPTLWIDLRHAECDTCSTLADKLRERPEVVTWCAEQAVRRAAITADHSLLSDEIAPPLVDISEHPFLKKPGRHVIAVFGQSNFEDPE